MVAKQIRFTEELDSRAKVRASRMGISFNALVQIALAEYLDAKELQTREMDSRQTTEEMLAELAELDRQAKEIVAEIKTEGRQNSGASRSVPLPDEFKLEPSEKSEPTGGKSPPGQSRNERRLAERREKKRTKTK